MDCILVVAWSNLISWTLCGQKNSIQDEYILTGGFTRYLLLWWVKWKTWGSTSDI